MSYYEEEMLRLEGVVVAQEILKHRCAWCLVPFFSCGEQHARSQQLEEIRKQLEQKCNKWEIP